MSPGTPIQRLLAIALACVVAAGCSTGPVPTIPASTNASTSSTIGATTVIEGRTPNTSTPPGVDSGSTVESSQVVFPRPDRALVNLRPRDTPFDGLVPWPSGIGYVRAWGGSRGMVTFPTEAAVPQVLRDAVGRDAYDVVDQAEIDGLLGLQTEHGVGLVYLVNVNDTLESQLVFVEQLVAAGIDIAAFEVGNELYLAKYARGDTSELGVTRSWSADDYVALLDEWRPALRAIAPTVAVYAIGASHGSTDSASDTSRRSWNDTLTAALAGHRDLVDGVTFHLYVGTGDVPDESATAEERTVPDDALDLGFLHTFGDLPVAITESGVRYAPSDPTGPTRAEMFWTRRRTELGPRDLFGVHVMYARSGRTSSSFALFDDEGRTPLGDRFAEWLTDWASPT